MGELNLVKVELRVDFGLSMQLNLGDPIPMGDIKVGVVCQLVEMGEHAARKLPCCQSRNVVLQIAESRCSNHRGDMVRQRELVDGELKSSWSGEVLLVGHVREEFVQDEELISTVGAVEVEEGIDLDVGGVLFDNITEWLCGDWHILDAKDECEQKQCN